MQTRSKMSKINFHIVDVFAQEKYAGKQLAVFLDLKQQLYAEKILQINREINFAESTFIRGIKSSPNLAQYMMANRYRMHLIFLCIIVRLQCLFKT